MSPTRLHVEVHRSLQELERPVSAQDLFLTLRAGGSSLGLSTVYRALKEAVRTGEAYEVRGAGREVLYVSTAAVFLHLICTRCGRVVQVRDDRFGEALRATALRHGFTGDGISVVVQVDCRNC